MRLLFVGDVNGKVGRRMVSARLRALREEHGADVCVVNGENATSGFGISSAHVDELLDAGADVITSGNHIWRRKETAEFILREPRLLRPANYPPKTPGKGAFVLECEKGRLGVVNLMGRVFMPPAECPFREADEILRSMRRETKMIMVDFHAEATSEKVAMGWHLDGRVSAVFGTHTHVQTADERILPKGTAFITDAGMTGPRNSVIGVKTEIVLDRFLSGLPRRFEVAGGEGELNGALVEMAPDAGSALSIERVRICEGERGA